MRRPSTGPHIVSVTDFSVPDLQNVFFKVCNEWRIEFAKYGGKRPTDLRPSKISSRLIRLSAESPQLTRYRLLQLQHKF